jgi:TolB-like protein/Flp pilus assembly protein TadD
MSAETSADSELEIAHVLFIDIVGYSKRLVNEQTALLKRLNSMVRGTKQFRKADNSGKLITIPTGDGMALAFFTAPDAPVRCAIEINKADQEDPKIELRMGIHSGPVDRVSDVNQRINVAGTGINMAQRVMDCADGGHILLSRRSADDLAQYEQWKSQLHDLGEVEVKHGVRLSLVNFYDGETGNPAVPSKLIQAEQARQVAVKAGAYRKRRRVALLVGTLTVVALGIAIGTWAWHRRAALASAYKAGLTQIVEKSIAVLPFENFDPDKESNYFADGVQDDILTDLARVADLKVIGRRSVAQYRDTKQSAREIGQALQVAYLLEGSVRRLGGRITVTAHLIDTRTDAEKWTQRYDEELSNLFQIQNQISEAIVSQLKAVMTPEEKAAIEAPPTKDMQAYEMYLRAKALLTAAGLRAKEMDDKRPIARKLLEEAIARDPKFVTAYCLLSQVQATPEWAMKPTSEQLAAAKATAETAVGLAPQSGEAHLALGDLYYGPLNDRDRGVEEYQIAARSMPNSAVLHATLGDVAVDRGRWKEALQHLQKAVQIDPRDPDVAQDLIDFYMNLRWYDEAEVLNERTLPLLSGDATRIFWTNKTLIAFARGDLKAARAALEASPDHKVGVGSSSYHHRTAILLMLEGHYSEAADLVDRIPELSIKAGMMPRSGMNPFARGFYALTKAEALLAAGQQEKAHAAFQQSREGFLGWLVEHPEEADALGLLAIADAGLGNKEEALHDAEKAMQVWPMSREPLKATSVRVEAANVYARTGNPDAAIRLLQEMVKVPGGPTSGDLKLRPMWSELRRDARFAGVVKEAAKPIRID